MSAVYRLVLVEDLDKPITPYYNDMFFDDKYTAASYAIAKDVDVEIWCNGECVGSYYTKYGVNWR